MESVNAGTASAIADEVERYLRTGESDPLCAAWPGDILERAHQAHRDLRSALLDATRRLAAGRIHTAIQEGDTRQLTRSKVEPMVRGLFPRAEQDRVLAVLEKSVVFLTHTTIEGLLSGPGFDSLAWTLANLYLNSLRVPLLGPDSPRLVGLSDETICYVSAEYFSEEDPFADFIVHETAHVFHNCKRESLGLPSSRRKQWLLEIEYRKRETFAYSCEAYACILERGKTSEARHALAEEYAQVVQISDERVDAGEVADIVREAAGVRNGWNVIRTRCAPERRKS